MNKVKDTKNHLLNRKEVEVVITSESNPGFEKAKKLIAHEFKCAEELIVVKGLESRFGRDTFLVDAFIYDSADDLKRIEPIAKVKKAKGQ